MYTTTPDFYFFIFIHVHSVVCVLSLRHCVLGGGWVLEITLRSSARAVSTDEPSNQVPKLSFFFFFETGFHVA